MRLNPEPKQPTPDQIKRELRKKGKEARDRFEIAFKMAHDNFQCLDDLNRILDKFISSYIPF